MKRMLLFAIPLALGVYSVMPIPEPEPVIHFAQEVPVDDAEVTQVTDEELKLYIDVYGAMQLDHSLTIEDVLQTKNMSLHDFRDLERRIQTKERLVVKVREALVEKASQRSAFTEPRPAAN